MMRKIWQFLDRIGLQIQTKLLVAFLLATVIIMGINLYGYYNISKMMQRIDSVYETNASLNELQNMLGQVHNDMTEYLTDRNSDFLENYYRHTQVYDELLEGLNHAVVDNELLMMERNIRALSVEYRKSTDAAMLYRRGYNIMKYRECYEDASELYTGINNWISSLNAIRFQTNSENYRVLAIGLRKQEVYNMIILVLTGILNMLIVVLMTREITLPLRRLAQTADQVSGGSLEVEPVPVLTKDEVGVVTGAFNQMLESIKAYIGRLTASMELEQQLREKELRMETHLKDAQLKYLQAQIHPHFLFNTLNAGAQLAMMEDADRTYEYIQTVADFFRYNVRKNNEQVELREELALIDNYIYILNVRFSGEIQFEKQVDADYLSTIIPAMTLQPIVENCINHGIRGIEWPGKVTLKVYPEEQSLCVSISDNGIGMTQERIAQILEGKAEPQADDRDSNGIGIGNVISRLKLFYGTEDIVEITSDGPNLGTEVAIHIPLGNTEEIETEEAHV